MKNLKFILILASILFISCSKKDCLFLTDLEKKTITFTRSNKKHNTHKVKFYFSGKSNCNIEASVLMNEKPYLNFYIPKGKIDTTLSVDWYSDQIEIQIVSEECLIERLDICSLFFSI